MTYDKMGYTEKICLFCQIGAVHIYEEIQVTQESKCKPHLSVANKDRQTTIKYSSDSPSVNVGDWSSLFKNTNPSGCPITSCELKAADCKAPYNDKTFSMTSNSPWVVSANRQNLEGYESTVCVSCLVREDLSEIQNTLTVKQVGKLEVARIKFINYFTWDMVHGMVYKKAEEC